MCAQREASQVPESSGERQCIQSRLYFGYNFLSSPSEILFVDLTVYFALQMPINLISSPLQLLGCCDMCTLGLGRLLLAKWRRRRKNLIYVSVYIQHSCSSRAELESAVLMYTSNCWDVCREWRTDENGEASKRASAAEAIESWDEKWI